jgi:Methyltransferase domain
MLRSLIPPESRRRARQWHRDHVLRKAVAAARRAIRSHTEISDDLLSRLSYGWSNEGWAAKPALLRALLQQLDRPASSVLECGTGLSSLLISLYCEERQTRHLALEHDASWHAITCNRYASLGVSPRHLHYAPLVNHLHFAWYDIASVPVSKGPFDLVLCDGPPGATFGGRSGLLPSVFHYLQPGAHIIVDDMVRDDETHMVKSWLDMFPGRLNILETGTFHVVLSLN